MTDTPEDIARSQKFADQALQQIKARLVSAAPRNYEIWYAYVSGYLTDLSDKINEIISTRGSVTQRDLDRIYEETLSPHRYSSEVDTAGSKVMNEIDQVMAMMEASSTQAASYQSKLAGAGEKLGGADGIDSVRSILEMLVLSTREMERSNRALEQRLKQSRGEIKNLRDNLDAVRTESFTDPLTGLANRKFYDQHSAKALAEARASKQPLSLLATDIDFFKKFNDTYGHLTGDQVLRLVAQALKQNVKGQDIACRYGGEEFAVILPDTSLREAVTVAEHIRRAVMTKELVKRSTGENLGRITISIGVATLKPGDTVNSLYDRADQCLYAAKRGGRNRVVCETDPEMANGDPAAA